VQPDAIACGIPPDASEKARKLEDLGYPTLTAPDRLSDFLVQMPALISAAEATKSYESAPTCSTTTSTIPWWSRVRLQQSTC
jgi:hypothetical protein